LVAIKGTGHEAVFDAIAFFGWDVIFCSQAQALCPAGLLCYRLFLGLFGVGIDATAQKENNITFINIGIKKIKIKSFCRFILVITELPTIFDWSWGITDDLRGFIGTFYFSNIQSNFFFDFFSTSFKEIDSGRK
ncbi:hypothetical protein ASC93_19700, partial [Massilia sp. Root335]